MSRIRRELVFPLAAILGFASLVALGWNGSSGSLVRPRVEGVGSDPQHVFGSPNFLRSDEWLVITPLIVHQDAVGYHRVNTQAMGGQDVSAYSAVPYREWSILFRPQYWGFLVLPLDQAFAFHWWFPALVLALGTYALMLGVCPRRPGMAAAGAVALLFAPFVQWWFLTITTGSLGWAAGLVALYIALERTSDPRKVGAYLAAIAFATAAFMMILYPAYQIPCAWVAVAAIVGWTWRADSPLGLRTRLSRLGLAAAAAATGVGIFGVFLATRWEVVELQAGSHYPGNRVVPTGGGNLAWLFSGFLDGRLTSTLELPALLGTNSSEASTFVFVGIFLVGPALWLVGRSWRNKLGIDGLLVALLTLLFFFLAMLLVPGLDLPARLTLLSQVPAQRLFIGLGLLSLLVVAATIREIDRQGLRMRWPILAFAGATALAAQMFSGRLVHTIAPALSGSTLRWLLLALVVTAVVVVAARGHGTAALTALAALSIVASYRVNPLYDGVYDTRDTALGRAIVAVDRDDPGAWISIGAPENQTVLTEQPVLRYSGTALYPNFAAWTDLDADGANRAYFNRYARVEFSVKPGATALALPTADWVVVRFDGCGPFAQRRLRHVLSSQTLHDPCVRLRQTVTTPASTNYIYDIVERDDPGSG